MRHIEISRGLELRGVEPEFLEEDAGEKLMPRARSVRCRDHLPFSRALLSRFGFLVVFAMC
jgi:hypothetical protein